MNFHRSVGLGGRGSALRVNRTKKQGERVRKKTIRYRCTSIETAGRGEEARQWRWRDGRRGDRLLTVGQRAPGEGGWWGAKKTVGKGGGEGRVGKVGGGAKKGQK